MAHPKTFVTVSGAAAGYAQRVVARNHVLPSDEPLDFAEGGTDTGPTPFELLLAALGSCTSMTLGVYARRKGWPLEAVEVQVTHERVASEARADRIERIVSLKGPLTDEQRARLLQIADACPVHKLLAAGAVLTSRLAEDPEGPRPAQG